MENIIVYIYNKDLELIGQPYVTNYEEFIENPQEFFPTWNEEMYASKNKLQYPIIDKETNLIREKTQEELKLEGIIELADGEYIKDGKLITVEYDEKLGYLKKAWNKTEHIWYESATEEELQEKYYSIINTSKVEILENGYLFVDNLGGKHQQKCRDKDLALLGNCIAAHEDVATFSQETEELKTLWAFNDGDTLEMNLTELKKLRLQGAMFVQVVFSVEAQLKAQDSNIKFTKSDFIELINFNSDIKCWGKNL